MSNDYFNKEDKILIASILDKYNKYNKTGISTYSNFLNNSKLELITNYLNHNRIDYSIYKPYDFLDKSIIYFGKYQDFITFYKVKISNNIKHSDILGTLFSLGIKEEVIGDIIVENDYFYYTNLTRMDSFLESELTIIKKEPIKLEKVKEIILEKEHFLKSNILVSSMRIDCIVSKITNLSRKIISEMIKDKKILLNYKEVKNNSVLLKENDILSIRKYGRYKISSIKRKTNKDKIILEIIKYI